MTVEFLVKILTPNTWCFALRIATLLSCLPLDDDVDDDNDGDVDEDDDGDGDDGSFQKSRHTNCPP